ncbi:hypothetical protein [Micromonospora chalcea]|uniref:hypothetical protein n=1 Tax=Micromonospora chalcea TaxID=1874 RepID=UPI003D75B6A7
MTEADPTTGLIAAPSAATRVAVTNLVDYEIEREYGRNVGAEIAGATSLAVAGLIHDLRDEYARRNGGSDGVEAYARSVLRIMVRDGLTERLCQCRSIRPAARHPHGNMPCDRHFEVDVPPIDGVLLCGGCHVAESDARA